MSEQKESTPKKHKVDTADFLAFSDIQPTEFCPANSSSPQKNLKQSYRNNYSRNWNGHRFSGNCFRNNSYTSPEQHRGGNRSFNGPYKRYDSPNHSFNNSNQNYSYNNSWSRNESSYNSSKNMSNEGSVNILRYLHPSFTEDPWEKLERQKLQQQQQSSYVEAEVSNDSSSGSDEVPVEI